MSKLNNTTTSISDSEFVTTLNNRIMLSQGDSDRLLGKLKGLSSSYSFTYTQIRILDNLIDHLYKLTK